ncbi:MAG TPA: SpoIIE family protein phosphatase [Edaphobacter sp.]|jgi:serine phosphatase RsbU (regulator of sigma subunit)|nr:SpoIIE family protein phosphatase [Edaphobacter sp.]
MQKTSLIARTPLPTALPSLEELDIHSRYHSSRTGGDFFDAVSAGPHIVFLLTDIAGARDSAHTIAAAMQDVFRIRVPQLFTTEIINMMDTLGVLAHEVNTAIYNAAGGSRFAPTFLGCYNLPLGVLAYINSGGQPAIFRDRDGTRVLGHVTVPLGLFTHLTFEPAIQAFEPGAAMLLVTKGILESRHKHEPFGVERATALVEAFTSGKAFDLCGAILKQAHEFRKIPWYSPQNLPFVKPDRIEDLTAVALIRPTN